jgi:hypothetical protein
VLINEPLLFPINQNVTSFEVSELVEPSSRLGQKLQSIGIKKLSRFSGQKERFFQMNCSGIKIPQSKHYC